MEASIAQHLATQVEAPQPTRKMRGANNPLWNKGPSLTEQRLYLSRFATRHDRDTYHRTFNVLSPKRD